MSDLIERIKERIRREFTLNEDFCDYISVARANRIIDEESAKEPQEEHKCSECVRESIQAECVLDGCKFKQREPQECKWYKGINSVETCWGDIDIKTFNKFKRQGAKFCPYCGRKIKVVE